MFERFRQVQLFAELSDDDLGRICADAIDGSAVDVDARSLCLHSDTPGAVDLARRARQALEEAGVEVTSFVEVT
jgi:lactam utilization protein B